MVQNAFVAFGVIGLLVLLIGLIVLGPIVTIFAINHLFNAGIAINFWNWLCVAWFHVLIVKATS